MRLLWVLFLLMLTNGAFAQDTVYVSLLPDTPGYRIPQDFAGLSFEKNSLNRGYWGPSKDTLVQLFKTLQIQSVRIGGNSVDKDTFSNFATGTKFNKANLDSFYQFMEGTGCQVLHGLNFGGYFNPSLASEEVDYVMGKYPANIRGFEIGNEADLYHSNGLRPANYNVAAYDSQYRIYADTILFYNAAARLTGPVAATNYATFTLPFCRNMHGLFTLLTQHYYVGAGYSLPTRAQIVNLLNPSHQVSLLAEVNALVRCADSAAVPFRMAECNSLYNGGQYGVSDAFASALWALDYMYGLATTGCAGVNFHGGLGGAYTPLAYKNGVYSARPISYGIMAFNAGSRGRLIPSYVTSSTVNLSVYSTIDSLNNIYTTIINKDTLKDALVQLFTGNTLYDTATFITLYADSLSDTAIITLGGQTVGADGTCQPFAWQYMQVDSGHAQLLVRAGSAAIIKLSIDTVHVDTLNAGLYSPRFNSAGYAIFPNPTHNEIYLTSCAEAGAVVTVYDLLGSVVITQPVIGPKTELNLSELPPGLYFVKVTNSGVQVFTGKFVKQ